jgi:DNA-binding transcriptional MerR regulator
MKCILAPYRANVNFEELGVENIDVFELSEVADLVGLPVTTVKNWTIGRPLEIKPSIKSKRGTGFRNLYSREDVYVMALADRLTKDGFALETVKQVLKELKGRSDLFGTHYSALVISSSVGGPEIRFVTGPISIGVHERLREEVISRYVLDLHKLVALIQAKIKRAAAPRT